MASDEARHGIGGPQLLELRLLWPAGDGGSQCGVGDSRGNSVPVISPSRKSVDAPPHWVS
jgi:hypothetical protein